MARRCARHRQPGHFPRPRYRQAPTDLARLSGQLHPATPRMHGSRPDRLAEAELGFSAPLRWPSRGRGRRSGWPGAGEVAGPCALRPGYSAASVSGEATCRMGVVQSGQPISRRRIPLGQAAGPCSLGAYGLDHQMLGRGRDPVPLCYSSPAARLPEGHGKRSAGPPVILFLLPPAGEIPERHSAIPRLVHAPPISCSGVPGRAQKESRVGSWTQGCIAPHARHLVPPSA